MKYEYLKGSENDFEGAPEWATLYTLCNGEDYFFAEYHGEGARVYDIEKNNEFKIEYPFDGSGVVVIAERLPITEPEWDGVGIPPVGCECEFTFGPYEPEEFSDLHIKTPKSGQAVNVVSHKTTSHGNEVAIIYWDEDGAGCSICVIACCLKPLSTETDKKRDAAIESLMRIVCGPSQASATVNKIYEAIAAGKIPGVKLED